MFRKTSDGVTTPRVVEIDKDEDAPKAEPQSRSRLPGDGGTSESDHIKEPKAPHGDKNGP